MSYVYGDELGQYSGRVKTECELAEMAREHGEFRVYVVEVCAGPSAGTLGSGGGCGWNHLVQSYVLGDGVPRRRRAVSR